MCIRDRSTIDRGHGQGKHLSSSDNKPGTPGGAEYWEELAQNVASPPVFHDFRRPPAARSGYDGAIPEKNAGGQQYQHQKEDGGMA